MNLSKVLCRQVQFNATTRATEDGGDEGDGLTLDGYAAVFGEATRIDSWEGTFDETIRRGAFKKTLRERTPIMQFDHGRHALIGSIPIGVYSSVAEDQTGMKVEGRLADNWLIQPVRDAIASKAVTGMSFRFEVVRDEWRDNAGKKIDPTNEDERSTFYEILWRGEDHERGPLSRELIEVKVPEAGPVVFPAYGGTSVSVRAAELARSVLTDPELVHETRQALALGPRAGHVDLPDDPDLRRDIARAVLFPKAVKTFIVGERSPEPRPPRPERQDAPPAPGHPSDDVDQDDESTTEDTSSTDAPPETGHPSQDDTATDGRSSNDAPPAPGHPSLTDQEARQKRARLAYVTRQRVGKR